MNKNNNVIEGINVGLHNKVFRGECQKANKNLQGLIASLNFRLVSLFYSVCQCCWLALLFLICFYPVAAECPAEKNISGFCLHECA